ncbi:Conserved_hypothetical protein [Hexamita inflata]|uniref:Uncharacterized protein n=1 Tax=Hexamita inflata TaxID=28002 RepID=A0AA86R417_9EUKA|nr:Conserved hypothetical protein [Hexamita inflata]
MTSQVVTIFNDKCKPNQPLQTTEQCFKYLAQVKALNFDPIKTPLVEQLKFQQQASNAGESIEQMLLFSTLGKKGTTIESSDIKTMGQLLDQIRTDNNISGDLLAGLQQKQNYVQVTQQIIQQITGSSQVSMDQAVKALEQVKVIRAQQQNNVMTKPLIDSVLEARFASQYQQFAQLIRITFPCEFQNNQFQTATAIVSEFKSRVVQFEQMFNVSFITCLKACEVMPKYTEVPKQDFMHSAELTQYKQLIKEVFSIETDYPMQFVEYAQQILVNVQKKVKVTNIKDGIIQILNQNLLNQANVLYVKLGGKKGNFTVMEDFCQGVITLLTKYNKSQDMKLNEISEIASAYYYKQQNVQEKITLALSSEQMGLISKQLNQFIIEQVLSVFGYEAYFKLLNMQPSFYILQAVVNQLYDVLLALNCKQVCLIDQLEAFDAGLTERICAWFYKGKPGLSNLKKEFSRFESQYFAPDLACPSIFKNYIASIKFEGVPQQLPAQSSEIMQLINKQLGISTSFLNFAQIFQDILKTPLLDKLNAFQLTFEKQFCANIMFKVFGTTSTPNNADELESHLEKYKNLKTKQNVQENALYLEIFNYQKFLEEQTDFAINKDYVKCLQSVGTIFGFDSKANGANFCFKVDSFLELLQKEIKQKFNFILEYMAFLKQLFKNDLVLLGYKDPWMSQFTRMYLPIEASRKIIAEDLSKYAQVKKTVDMFVASQKNTTLTQMMEIVDTENQSGYLQLIQTLQEVEKDKFKYKQEQLLQTFTEALMKVYIQNKKQYQFIGFTQLVEVKMNDKKPLHIVKEEKSEPKPEEKVEEKTEEKAPTEDKVESEKTEKVESEVKEAVTEKTDTQAEEL